MGIIKLWASLWVILLMGMQMPAYGSDVYFHGDQGTQAFDRRDSFEVIAIESPQLTRANETTALVENPAARDPQFALYIAGGALASAVVVGVILFSAWFT